MERNERADATRRYSTAGRCSWVVGDRGRRPFWLKPEATV
jgi:hypothetical protein